MDHRSAATRSSQGYRPRNPHFGRSCLGRRSMVVPELALGLGLVSVSVSVLVSVERRAGAATAVGGGVRCCVAAAAKNDARADVQGRDERNAPRRVRDGRGGAERRGEESQGSRCSTRRWSRRREARDGRTDRRELEMGLEMGLERADAADRQPMGDSRSLVSAARAAVSTGTKAPIRRQRHSQTRAGSRRWRWLWLSGTASLML
jgi:hypothetical protein